MPFVASPRHNNVVSCGPEARCLWSGRRTAAGARPALSRLDKLLAQSRHRIFTAGVGDPAADSAGSIAAITSHAKSARSRTDRPTKPACGSGADAGGCYGVLGCTPMFQSYSHKFDEP